MSICCEIGCHKEVSAKGRCEKHYRAYKVAANPNVYKDVEKRRQARHRERKLLVMQLMGGKCKLCGYCKNTAALEFHHLDPTVKEHEPKQILRRPNIDVIMAELSKCVLVCKNCHAEIHHPEKGL